MLLSCFFLTAQDYKVFAIAPELFLNANAVVHSDEISIEVKSIDKVDPQGPDANASAKIV